MTSASKRALAPNMSRIVGSPKRRKRKGKKRAAKRATSKRSGSSRARGKRKLKFGSPAWRKKYLGR